ncbi:MAG: arginine--tRNA ligase [Desulfovibrio sp.]|uniref:arginine--tRNA ligase n=1 Tax=Desulfovibrio sp. 7SRBS1 TaxID=3378064 RepID=UPI003B411070
MRAYNHLKATLEQALASLELPVPEKMTIEPPRDKSFGDLATNAAMMLSKVAKKAPRKIAEDLKAVIEGMDTSIERIDVAGPGFLNFFFSDAFWRQTVVDIRERGEEYGRIDLGQGRRVQVEYVSANPTGPLHIGHGRGAAVGDSLARIMRAAGWEVSTEYYLNDAGRQMLILGKSIFCRYQQHFGADIELFENGYKGEYIMDLAKELADKHGKTLLDMAEDEAVSICREYGMAVILDGIKQDLQDFNVEHQVWFSERSLTEAGKVDETFDFLRKEGLAYDEDGALWFRSTDFKDDKNRVLRKSSGDLTYFASDIAYHDDKYKRGFDLVIDIWGADHHGYIQRMKAAVQALGKEADQLEVILVQLVNLLKGGEQIAMSTRAGKFETLADVVEEVGADSARFIFLSRKSDSKLDFDLDLVKEKSMDNPVYYVQYAHARICSVFRKAEELDIAIPAPGQADLSPLNTLEDQLLLRCLEQFPDAVQASAHTFSPHHISYYLRELAGLLHRYYSANKILTAGDDAVIAARLALIDSVRQALANGLGLLGVSAPESM